jgi:SAM-dependent methyltransferase
MSATAGPPLARLLARLRGGGVRIKRAARNEPTLVDDYWSRHTVNSTPFTSAEESEAYLVWRNEQYPLFPEFMDIWGDHAGQVVLDYGCGPGNDVTGYMLYSGARKVIGIDVSAKALELARHRVELHGFRADQVKLVQTADDTQTIPLKNGGVDYVNCGGVIHHTSHPYAILRELHRVLRPGGTGCIMVYNRRSLWFHLYVAYVRMLIDGDFAGLAVEEAFKHSTDGEDCPISIPYDPDVFIGLLENAGFEADFIGGYISVHELKCWAQHGQQAIGNSLLAEEHRSFLRRVAFDDSGYPMVDGKHAGIGGVYRLRKP